LKNHSLFTSLFGAHRSSCIKFQHGTCLRIWRFHHIDLSQCPQVLPDRYVVESVAMPQQRHDDDDDDPPVSSDMLRVRQAIEALSPTDLGATSIRTVVWSI
jgi:hypothetical protein